MLFGLFLPSWRWGTVLGLDALQPLPSSSWRWGTVLRVGLDALRPLPPLPGGGWYSSRQRCANWRHSLLLFSESRHFNHQCSPFHQGYTLPFFILFFVFSWLYITFYLNISVMQTWSISDADPHEIYYGSGSRIRKILHTDPDPRIKTIISISFPKIQVFLIFTIQ